MKVCVLIPAKGFVNAKQRLSPMLAAREREILAEAMLRDVLGQAAAAPARGATFVVTADHRVAEIAGSFGAEVIRESEERGETEAVHFALSELKRRGFAAVLVIPADIPLVRSSDIEELLAGPSHDGLTSPFALLVPSHDHMGSNALLLAPPDAIRLRFGYDSFSYHLRQAAAARIPFRTLENARIALDIDEPSDLRRCLLAEQCGRETRVAAMRMGLLEEPPRGRRSANG